jgi:hypothetical protein
MAHGHQLRLDLGWDLGFRRYRRERNREARAQ